MNGLIKSEKLILTFFMPYNKNGYNINFIPEYIKASEEENVFQEIYYDVLNINKENNIEEVISENEINSFCEIEGPEPRTDIEENETKHYRSEY